MEKRIEVPNDLVVDINSNTAGVRWKNNKVVSLVFIFCGIAPVLANQIGKKLNRLNQKLLKSI